MNFNSLFIIKRLGVYCLGLFSIALGVSFSVRSDLGVSPVNAIPYTMSLITKKDIGICTTAFFLLLILLQIILLRKDFLKRNLLQILCSFLFGSFISFAYFLTAALPECSNYTMRLFYLLISMIFIALGLLFYLAPNLLSLPSEGVMQAVSYKFGLTVSTSKIIFDCMVVLIAATLSFGFLHELKGVREGTVIAAICVGLFLKLFMRIGKTAIDHFLAMDPKDTIVEEIDQ